MTTIQIFALIGVFLIGAIFGAYAVYKFLIFAIRHSTIVGMGVGRCGDPLCDRRHLTLHLLNATASLGVSRATLNTTPEIADALEAAFATADVDGKPTSS